MVEADVAIVGAGAAGCLLAIVLGRAGRRVIVLERGRNPPLHGGDFLKPSGLKVLSRLGLADDIAHRDALRRTHIHYYHDGVLSIDYDYAQHTDLGYFLIVPYARTMAVLLEAMARLPSIELQVNAGVVATRVVGDDIKELLLEDGRCIRADVVVGADGVRSSIRAAMGLPDQPEPCDQDIYIAAFPMVPSVWTVNRLYMNSRRWMVYLYPETRTSFRVGVSLPSAQGAIFAGPLDDFIDSIRPFVTASDDALAAISSLSGFVRVPTAHLNAARYVRGNAVVLGDAAHCAHPVTGQGLNMSLEDSETLGAVLNRYFDGHASRSQALSQYERLRHAINERIVSYSVDLLRSFQDRNYYLSHFDFALHGSVYPSHRLEEG
jgi:2-polyprenyl-6-methoxyphenol hydroxylase-like FAD-dependent oxidoreductase